MPSAHASGTLAIVRRALFFLLTLAAWLVASSAAAGIARPIHERRLGNGLRVIVCPDPAAADVTLLVRYDVGARDEPAGLEGIAHVVEHVMFTGSKHVAPGRFAELLEQAGATNVNGVTSLDWTIYHETLPPERLELGLWLESDRMGYLLDRFDEAALGRARAEVRNEHRDRVTEVPLGGLSGIQQAELFPAWHPYHHLPIGTAASIDAIGMGDVIAWLGTWYGPGNATVIIAGKADPQAATALVERYFGSLPARPAPQRPVIPVIEPRVPTALRVVAAVTGAEARVAWVTPRSNTRDDAVLDVAAAILTGRGAGWLHKLLTMGPSRVCTNVGSEQRSMRLASVFEIRAFLAEGHALVEAVDAIRQALARFDAGVSDDEMRRAQRILYNGRLFTLESSLGWAMQIMFASASGPMPATFDARVGEYAAITPAEVRAAVRTWLVQQPAVYTFAIPQRGALLSGKLVERKEMTP